MRVAFIEDHKKEKLFNVHVSLIINFEEQDNFYEFKHLEINLVRKSKNWVKSEGIVSTNNIIAIISKNFRNVMRMR